MSRGPLVQVVLVVCGVLAVLVMWDERKHEAALVWAAGWTACCWLLAPPGWARWPMLALTATALLVTTRAVRHGRAQRHAAHRTEQERELELLLACAQREQLDHDRNGPSPASRVRERRPTARRTRSRPSRFPRRPRNHGRAPASSGGGWTTLTAPPSRRASPPTPGWRNPARCRRRCGACAPPPTSWQRRSS